MESFLFGIILKAPDETDLIGLHKIIPFCLFSTIILSGKERLIYTSYVEVL